MSFASVTFWLFLPVVFGLYWARSNRRWQNGVLLVASYIFYGWWDWRFCGLMLFSSLVDYTVGRALGQSPAPALRRFLLAVSVVTHLVLLGFFKYFNFFADSLALALSAVGVEVGTTSLNVVLPVGISFYTFQSMSYAVDVYRRQLAPVRAVGDYLTFVAFFPQLVAGPIERASRLLPQFGRLRTFSRAAAVSGSQLLLWGLTKKMLVADNLGGIADDIYGRAGMASAPELALGTLAFAFQIYADFSGYSDMAAGLGRLFGISLSRNFIFPYFARSPAEFWRRWHVTLSAWLRDYVFIPLGGSRGPLSLTLRNIVLTLLLSGLWHGAAWHFVLWGGLHGLGLCGVHAWRAWRHASSRSGVVSAAAGRRTTLLAFLQMAATFGFTCWAWVLFRADSLAEALEIYGRLLSGWFDVGSWRALGPVLSVHAIWLAGVGFFVAAEWFGRERWNPIPWERLPSALRWAGYTTLVWAVVFWGTRRSAEFIYFQF